MGFPLRRGKMLDSTEIKGAVRLKISHWPKLIFFNIFFPDFFDVVVDRWDILTIYNPKLFRSKSTLYYKSDQATQKSILDFSWSQLLAKSLDHENDLIFLVMTLGP
jgi:hypothetical protein